MNQNKYYSILGSLQNEPENVNTDIMTITGLMNDEQKLVHLERYLKRDHDALQIHNIFRNLNGKLIGE